MSEHNKTDEQWIAENIGYQSPDWSEPKSAWPRNLLNTDINERYTAPWHEDLTVIEPSVEIDINTLRAAGECFFQLLNHATIMHIPDTDTGARHINNTINTFNSLREKKIRDTARQLKITSGLIDDIGPDPHSPANPDPGSRDQQQRDILTDQFIEDTLTQVKTIVSLDTLHGDLCLRTLKENRGLPPRGSIYDADKQEFLRIDGADLRHALSQDYRTLPKHRFFIAGGPYPDPRAIHHILKALQVKYNDFCLTNTADTRTDDQINDLALKMGIDVQIVNTSHEHEQRLTRLRAAGQTKKARQLTSIIEPESARADHEKAAYRDAYKNMICNTKRYAPIYHSPGERPDLDYNELGQPCFTDRHNVTTVLDQEHPAYYTPMEHPARDDDMLRHILNLNNVFSHHLITGCITMDNSFQANMVRARAADMNVPIHDFHALQQHATQAAARPIHNNETREAFDDPQKPVAPTHHAEQEIL